ncbi:hypothetical protein COLO4_10452 [Corchorus olitorius]|uniref:Uncharacterized protein n=1 Tax=Corchorus olitorius TaxID=93759 RepID=A0A1R3K8J4_9ROSI|nr:hypothetical protein COLO4_10452 [Corchorus olitorius]
MATDWMAKWSCNQTKGLQILSRFPMDLESILKADGRGSATPKSLCNWA